ncbi:retinol dehydrogenase 7-like [Acipenser oxyrinchus oxyrinchus]|uniref:Retinol dehydrogenase 7-like n=1 Tax=Acipenser oxyrinchus oxyrinchus TaxID=40147 RepID=A0AAD8DAR0_ACIOX|nr:retinol dehydrogenase 7-like [Acipenser oxyrinchus oxyrinchus]
MFLYLIGLVALLALYRWYRETKRVPNISDKYVYITGCDSGFGNLLAKSLDELGYHVIAACFTEKGEDDLKKSASKKLTTIHVDVAKSESIQKAAAFIKSKVGEAGLWGLVNNAGVSVPAGPCDWLTIQDYKQMLDVNLMGVIEVTLSVIPLIKKSQGRIVNVASVFGRISPVGGAYCISKYGVEAFNDSLRRNLKDFGIKVLCIEPGFFRTTVTNTEVIEKNLHNLWDKLPQEVRDDYGSDYVENVLKLMKEQMDKLSDPDLMKVVSCMEHALSAVYPRTRYSPGWDAKLFWLPLSYMPTLIADYVLARDNLKPAKAVV